MQGMLTGRVALLDVPSQEPLGQWILQVFLHGTAHRSSAVGWIVSLIDHAEQRSTPDPQLRAQTVALLGKFTEAWNNNDAAALSISSCCWIVAEKLAAAFTSTSNMARANADLIRPKQTIARNITQSYQTQVGRPRCVNFVLRCFLRESCARIGKALEKRPGLSLAESADLVPFALYFSV